MLFLLTLRLIKFGKLSHLELSLGVLIFPYSVTSLFCQKWMGEHGCLLRISEHIRRNSFRVYRAAQSVISIPSIFCSLKTLSITKNCSLEATRLDNRLNLQFLLWVTMQIYCLVSRMKVLSSWFWSKAPMVNWEVSRIFITNLNVRYFLRHITLIIDNLFRRRAL